MAHNLNRMEIDVEGDYIAVTVIIGPYRFLPFHCETWAEVLPMIENAPRMAIWISTLPSQ